MEPVSLSKCLSKPCYLTFIQISTTCHYSSLRRLYSSPPGSSKRSSECMPVSSFCLNKTPLYIPLFQTISIFYSSSTVFTLAPKLWKSLHRPVRLTGPLILFKSLLKTQLYKLAFLKYFGHYSNNLFCESDVRKYQVRMCSPHKWRISQSVVCSVTVNSCSWRTVMVVLTFLVQTEWTGKWVCAPMWRWRSITQCDAVTANVVLNFTELRESDFSLLQATNQTWILLSPKVKSK